MHKFNLKEYVRPFIALTCLYGSLGLAAVGKDVPEWLLSLTAMSVTWWFRSRDQEKQNGN